MLRQHHGYKTMRPVNPGPIVPVLAPCSAAELPPRHGTEEAQDRRKGGREQAADNAAGCFISHPPVRCFSCRAPHSSPGARCFGC